MRFLACGVFAIVSFPKLVGLNESGASPMGRTGVALPYKRERFSRSTAA